MKKYMILTLMMLFLCGCGTSKQLAKNLGQKSLSGDGTYVKTFVGIDPETKIPTLDTTVLSGNFVDIKQGQNFVDFSIKQTSSIFNASSKTVLIKATIQTKETSDLHESIKEISAAFKEIYTK